MKMSGAVQAKLSASNVDGRQALAVVANSDRMSVGANRLEGLKVDLKVGDLWGGRDVSGVARLARADVSGASISDIRLIATARDDSSDLDFTGLVRGLAVKANGRLFGGPPAQARIGKFRRKGRRPRRVAGRPGHSDLRRRWRRHSQFRAARRFRPI